MNVQPHVLHQQNPSAEYSTKHLKYDMSARGIKTVHQWGLARLCKALADPFVTCRVGRSRVYRPQYVTHKLIAQVKRTPLL